jgi:hypothetical protein
MDFSIHMDAKVSNGSKLQKLMDDFIKETNSSPDEYDLVLPTAQAVRTAALEMFWASKEERQLNHRFNYLGSGHAIWLLRTVSSIRGSTGLETWILAFAPSSISSSRQRCAKLFQSS